MSCDHDTNISQYYQICVNIIEARDLLAPMSSFVTIRVGDVKKATAIQKNSDSPYFNEYFVFDIFSNFEALLNQTVKVTVWQRTCCCQRDKEIGTILIDVAIVWKEPEHEFYHKWAILSSSKDENNRPMGYLQLDISILAKDGLTRKTKFVQADDIIGNLLQPSCGLSGSVRAQYKIHIHSVFLWDNTGRGKKQRKVYVAVRFAGRMCKSSCQGSLSKELNEAIIFTGTFPPLCHNILFQIITPKCCKRKMLHQVEIEIAKISDGSENGFIPTFGPAYIYIQSGPFFKGQMLVSLSTDVETKYRERQPMLKKIEPIDTKSLWDYCDVLGFVAIFECSFMEKKYSGKALHFELALGENTSAASNTYQTSKTSKKNTKAYLPLHGLAACVFLRCTLPDVVKRMHDPNAYQRLLVLIKSLYPETLISRCCDKSIINIINVSVTIEEQCKILIDKSKNQKPAKGQSKLDVFRSEKLTRILKEFSSQILIKVIKPLEMLFKGRSPSAEEVGSINWKTSANKDFLHNKFKKKDMFQIIHLLNELIKQVDGMVINPQQSWPEIVLWIKSGKQRIGFHKLSPRSILDSEVKDERGTTCGEDHTIFLKPKKCLKSCSEECECVVGKAQVLFWLGPMTLHQKCKQSLPKGWRWTNDDSDSMEENLPNELFCAEVNDYMYRVYIHQGRINPGQDPSGLCDPRLTATIQGQQLHTKLLKETLNPIWDESLSFEPVQIYGDPEHIKLKPPLIVIEIYDKDSKTRYEMVGQAAICPVVKLVTDTKFVPSNLKWESLEKQGQTTSDVLIGIELIQISKDVIGEITDLKQNSEIPYEIRPRMKNFRGEIYFWGLRDLKRLHIFSCSVPKVSLEIAAILVDSGKASEYHGRSVNFLEPRKIIDLVLPEQHDYWPSLSFKLIDCKCFGCTRVVGAHLEIKPSKYYKNGDIKTDECSDNEIASCEQDGLNIKTTATSLPLDTKPETTITQYCCCFIKLRFIRRKVPIEQTTSNKTTSDDMKKNAKHFTYIRSKILFNRAKNKDKIKIQPKTILYDDEKDWWTKFYNSITNNFDISDDELGCENTQYFIEIYDCELEELPQFNGFHDWCTKFNFRSGSKRETSAVASLKAAIQFTAPSEETDHSGDVLLTKDFSNEPVDLIVRVYIIRGMFLCPRDTSGKSDPYIVISLGDEGGNGGQKINDRTNYIPKQIHPTFGRCFQVITSLPRDHTLQVSIWDMDITTKDDLIGSTTIDLENRYYSKHRAHCGLSNEYNTSGYNKWRDRSPPSRILRSLCRQNGLEEPLFQGSILKVAGVEFLLESCAGETLDESLKLERLSLRALHQWHRLSKDKIALVPEHVETRSLFNPRKPGLEQGRIQMWVDIFPGGPMPPPAAVVITPRIPEKYELRVIIWNTDDVVLQDDSFFLGEKISDIYVTAWLNQPNKLQSTDVHYNSLTGEGNFNWRMIFTFNYLYAEGMVVDTYTDNAFSVGKSERKQPCRLHVHVWDNDTFSKDDFLGSLTLDLRRLPRCARGPKKCTMDMLEGHAPKLNLFRTRSVRGWWPIIRNKPDGKEEITGKIEMELEILKDEDAQKCPAGKARHGPQELPKPKRPDVSFSWFRSPWKLIKYAVFKRFKGRIIICMLCVLLVLFGACMIYAFPGYSVKRLLGA